MGLIHDPRDEQAAEAARVSEVRWFYWSLAIMLGIELLVFWAATGVAWWRFLLLNTPEYPFTLGRLVARILVVPAPAVAGAYLLSDTRHWFAPVPYVVFIGSFAVLLFFATGIWILTPGGLGRG